MVFFKGLRRQVAGLRGELEALLAIGGGALGELGGRVVVVEPLVHLGDAQHDVGVGRVLGEARLELGELAAQVVVREVAPLLDVDLARAVLVLDQVAAVLDGLVARPAQRGFGRQVLAGLDRVLVARVGLERALVVLERLPRVAGLVHHRTGALEALGVGRRDLGDELVHGRRRLQVARALERHSEQEVRFRVERVRREVALERLRRRIVALGLEQRLGRRQRHRAHRGSEELAALRGLGALAQRLAQSGARFTLIGVDVDQLLVDLDGEVPVPTAHGLVGLLEMLGKVHREPARRGRRASAPAPFGAEECRCPRGRGQRALSS
jgi:hypothetical protein